MTNVGLGEFRDSAKRYLAVKGETRDAVLFEELTLSVSPKALPIHDFYWMMEKLVNMGLVDQVDRRSDEERASLVRFFRLNGDALNDKAKRARSPTMPEHAHSTKSLTLV